MHLSDFSTIKFLPYIYLQYGDGVIKALTNQGVILAYVIYTLHKNVHRCFHDVMAVLMITSSHQSFSGQSWCLSGETQFDQTRLLHIINGKVSVFIIELVISGQLSILIISTVMG